MFDKYKFDLQRTGFLWNEVPDCRRDHGLDPDEPYIVFYNGEGLAPYVLQVEEKVDVHRLMYETTVRSVMGTPMWGQRANSAVFDFYQNALIYMTPEMLGEDDFQNDWRVNLMIGTIDMMQNDSTNFIPILVPFEQPEEHILIPQLSTIIDITKEELPNFYMIHPLSDRVVALPDKLENPEDFSSEIIMLWAIRQAHSLDIELFEYNIQMYEEKVAKGEEEIQEWETQ